jgi:hypothetical protein
MLTVVHVLDRAPVCLDRDMNDRVIANPAKFLVSEELLSLDVRCARTDRKGQQYGRQHVADHARHRDVQRT